MKKKNLYQPPLIQLFDLHAIQANHILATLSVGGEVEGYDGDDVEGYDGEETNDFGI